MNNSQYHSKNVKETCENKLKIEFRGKKEYIGWYYFNGKKTTMIIIPKGRKFIPKGTYGSMARQLKLTIPEFDKLLECPLKKEQYDLILEVRI